MHGRMRVSRRTLLRGLGVSVSLPWLEAMGHAAATTAAGAPTRMAFIFVPNGVHLDNWTPNSEGYGFDLPKILEPLAPVQDDLLVLSGLTHDKGRSNNDGPGDHARSASVFLTGAQPRKTDGENIRSGISVDQAAAQVVGHHTRFSSIELGTNAGRSAGSCDSGYSCAYSSNISWSSETTPVRQGREIRVWCLIACLQGLNRDVRHGLEQRRQLNQSVLDFIADDAERLHKRLGRSDNRKLDEYLTAFVNRASTRESSARRWRSRRPGTSPPEDIPDDYQEHIRLMCDMIVLAFQTDSTRIATLMFANAGDNKSYPFIGVRDGHHQLSHHREDPVKLRDYPHQSIPTSSSWHICFAV